jgi:hypothetical protein
MFRRHSFCRFYTLLLVLALLSHSVLPVAHAQSTTPLYLPIITNGNAVPQTDLVFRTRITVQTPAQWRDLQRMEVVILEQEANAATVLVDDLQLEDLARLRYNPDVTNALATMAAHDSTLQAAVADLLQQAAALGKQIQATEVQGSDATLTAARTELRTYLQSLEATQLEAIAQAASVDTDNDGLTDDREFFWCTSTTNSDSDFDGVNDGQEVARLKAWLNNERATPPSDTGQPFLGWPDGPNDADCPDNDRDSVPNLAERWELGLNMQAESTDRDQFDDGQELFGTTNCPGSGTACGYGSLPPANTAGIVLFPEMPGWVRAPGNHPFVAGLPLIKIDVDETSFKVRTVTEVTTDHVIASGAERSYSTAKTDGTSTSVENTMTWNNWQETSRTIPDPQLLASELDPQFHGVIASELQGNYFGLKVTGATLGLAGAVGGALCIATAGIGCAVLAGAGIVGAGIALTAELLDQMDDLQSQAKANRCDPNAPYVLPKCVEQFMPKTADPKIIAEKQTQTAKSQDLAKAGSGTQYSAYGQSNQILVQPAIQISYPPQRPTTTTTVGRSEGGSYSTTHTQYQEHTVTNGEAFSTSESWGNATAINSVYAADLRFSYTLRNIGTDFARHICEISFNIYIGNDPNPAITYDIAPDLGGDGCLSNIQPNLTGGITRTSRALPLTLDQMRTIDLGGPVRIVVNRYVLSSEDFYSSDAASKGIIFAVEDGIEDGDEVIDTYLIPTWSQETVLNVLTRYFPHEIDDNGTPTNLNDDTLVAIWTPEYNYSANPPPAWCQQAWRPTDYPTKALWCKHVLSAADWWNVYTDGLGNSSEGFQNTQAIPGGVTLFRFNQDSDLDGFSDRTEKQLGTEPNDTSSFPHPEVLAGVHNLRNGNRVTSTLSLLNSGIYDAYGVEAVMVAPDDSVSITNNTVGGSGRVRALKQVIVGSSLKLQTPLPAAWTQANHATLGVGGYYTGPQDRTYTFTVTDCPVGGCAVGSGTWKLNWSDGRGATGQLAFGANYQSPNFQAVGVFGLTLALYSGNVANGESFTVNARTPRDTFQYTINREPYTEPLVIVSYNDPQGNHRFVLPSQAMSLTAPTANLQQYAGSMLDDVGVEIVTSRPFTVGINSATLLVNNPSAKTLQNARLFLEVINISGTVVSEVPTQVNLPPGPTSVPVSFNTSAFNPAYRLADDYIVMAFLTDYQGNILDTAGRPLSSFQVDPLPELAADDTTLSWNIGTVTQGTLLKHALALANTGFGRLYTYIPPTSGLALNTVGSRTVGAADQPLYELTLRTADLPVGPYDQTITLATSDPAQPTRSLRVYGAITTASGDTSGGVLQRPLDFAVTVPGSHSQGEWVDFTHNLGPEPQKLHPVKVYSQDYSTLYGVGKYAIGAEQGASIHESFGDGRDGMMPNSGNLDNSNGFGIGIVNSGSTGSTQITVTDAHAVWRINHGDAVLIHQTQGNSAGCWEINKAISDFTGGGTFTLDKPLRCNYYSDGGNNRAQILRVPQYSTCNITGTVTPLYGWNGSSGGIFAVMCADNATINGVIANNGGNGSVTNTTFAAGGTGGGFRGGNGHRPPSGSHVRPFTGEGQTGVSLEGDSNQGGSGMPTNGNAGTAAAFNNGWLARSGGGGSYGTAGNRGTASQAGIVVGDDLLANLLFGGGGGGGGRGELIGTGVGGGGAGGGIVAIFAKNLMIDGGAITARGGAAGIDPNTNGQGHEGGGASGGAGSGGAILLKAGRVNVGMNYVIATGGTGTSASSGLNGAGGNGRIRIEYCETVDGITNPPASMQKLNCYITEQVETAPYSTALLNLPESFSNGRTYNVQFGRKLDFGASGEQTAMLRVPAGLVANSTLDVLLSNAGTGDVTLKLDIGNNGTWDWESTQNVTNAATFSSPDLSAAFNQYWSSHGSPTTGNIEIPVKLWLSKAATVFITNLQQLNLTASGAGSALDPKPLDVTVAITGSHTAGEWVQFTHNLGPEPQSLHPVTVYSQDYMTRYGVGKYNLAVPPVDTGWISLLQNGGFESGNTTGWQVTDGSAWEAATGARDTGWISRLQNGGFETGNFNNWSVGPGSWVVEQFEMNASRCNTCPYSVAKKGGTNPGWVAQEVDVSQYRSLLDVGAGYVDAYGHVRTQDSGDKGRVVIQYKAGSTVLATYDSGYRAPGYTWERLQDSRQIPVGTDRIRFEFWLDTDGDGDCKIDSGAMNIRMNYNDPAHSGAYKVRRASGSNPGSIYQDISLAAWQELIKRGTGTINVGAWLKSIDTNDQLRLQYSFLQSSQVIPNTGYDSGWARPADWLQYQSEQPIPVGADSVRIALSSTGDADAVFDDVFADVRFRYHIAEQIETAPYTSGNLNLPETFTDGRTYKVQFGRKLDFTAAGNQVTTLRVPAGLYNSVQLDALVSSLPANATLTLDVGNNGSTEWSGAVVNNSTNVSADLAAAFTAYWRSQNSPSGGTLDMPIKVTTTQPGQILLTNLQVSATGSRLRYARVPVANYTRFLLDFTAGNGGTVALDLGDDGTIDWSTPLAAPRQLTENLNDELNAYLAGKSGNVDVPVRFYLAPLHPITLNDYQATVASTLDLIANSITVGNGAVTAAGADSILIDADSTATVQATLRNNSSSASGPVTAAFFATATGWGDWYIGSAFVANIAATSNVTVTIPWNTTGFSGTVPVKMVINPYQRVAETNYNNNRKETSVVIPPPLVLPTAPTGLVATMAATNRITLTWTDASSNESGFQIERSLTGVNGWTQIATAGANVTTYASIGLACGKAYFYRVRSTNSNGDSAFSNVATTLTRLCTPALQPVTGITQTQLTLVWIDNNSNESGFKIERSATGTTPWSQIATVGANVTTYTNSGLQCGTPHYYRVRAYNGGNNSAYSAIVNATTTICTPAAPTLLAATAISATQINLSWNDASSNESGFKIERSPDGVNSWTLLTTLGANVTSYANSGLACATTYHYRVRATNAGGDSPASNVANATTPACLLDLIFADGFESGSFSAWSGRPVGSNLRVTATAALAGSSQGMAALMANNTGMYITDQRPNAEPRYRTRFYFDPNTITMTSGDAHFIFYGYQGTTTVVLRIEFRRLNSSYQLRFAALNDTPTTGAATWRTSSYVTISDAPHFLELDWQAATAAGANNGSLTFWIDGIQRTPLTGLDNDTRRIDIARLGPIGGLDTGTRGSYYFDAFESRRRSYIGPVGGSALAAELTTTAETLTTTVGTVLATSPLHATEATTLTANVAGLGVEITLPAISDSGAITAQLYITDTQSLPAGYTLLGDMLAVQSSVLVTQPVTMTIAYGTAATRTLTTTVSLQQWNASAEQWEALPAQVNHDAQTITAAINVPATLALWQPETETLPVESVEENGETEETAAPDQFSIYLPLVQK